MLTTLQKGACALIIATSVLVTSAQAAEQEVMIMDLGYFPAVINVVQGDTIVFVNNGAAEHIIEGPSESWVSDPIAIDGTYILEITDETPDTFSGVSSGGELIEGSFSYEMGNDNVNN